MDSIKLPSEDELGMESPEEMLAKAAKKLCKCDLKYKKPKRLKKFTYVLHCDKCGTQGPLHVDDEE